MAKVQPGDAGARGRRLGLMACAAIAPLLIAGPGRANPEGAQVAAGQVAVTSAGATTTVTQTTHRAIVNWQGFSIGAGETTRFVQPSAAAAILNRVTGGDPSKLMGQLTSNGRVYLINPHGVVVGPEGRINTGGFVASTLDAPDAQFLGGGPLTFQGTSGAGIKVLGTIEASGGDVVLIAANIETRGRIAAPNGQAILGAGGSLLYMPDSGGDIVIQAPAPAAAIDTHGTIEAAAVQLKSAGGAYALAVNVGGTVSATAVRDVGGRVVIDGGEGAATIVGAVAAHVGDAGGVVSLTGGDVTVAEAGRIEVSGQGAGDGGVAKVIAARTAVFEGTILGGGANGGQAEVSGDELTFHGTVQLAGLTGKAGHLVLDPTHLSIDAATASAIVTALNGGADVDEIQNGVGDSLSVDAPIVSNSIRALKLQAPDIAINANISLPNGSLLLYNTGAAGPLTLAPAATITTAHIYVPGHFDVVNLQGAVITPDFSVDNGFSPTSFTATNAGNRIGAFAPVQIATFSGDVSILSSTAMSVDGELDVFGDLTLRTTGGNLTFASSAVLAVTGTSRLAGANAFVNHAGTALIAGSGRTVIYTSTEAAPFDDGGLGYAHRLGVSFGADPQAGNVIYVSSAIPLLTITADSFSRLYGQPDPTFTASFSGGSASDLSSPVQFRIVQGGHAAVGTYTIEPFGATASGFTLQYVAGTLTVTPAPLTIAAIDVARLYGAANPMLSASYAGLVNGDTAAVVSGLMLTTSATPGSGVGRYAITGAGASAANYAITYVPAVLTVNPAPLTIAANGAIRTYGAANPTLSATFEGLVNGDQPSVVSGLVITTTATQASDVGHYPVSASGGTAANYTISYRVGQLLITPAPLTITVNDASMTEGARLPPFSVSYSGLQNGDDPARIIQILFDTDATSGSPSGVYAVRPVARVRGPANYALRPVTGKLTVVARPPVIYSATFTSSKITVGPPNPADMELLFSGPINYTPPDTTELAKALNAPQTPVLVCNQLCYAFGKGAAGQEFNKVLDDLAAKLGGQPPLTGDALRSMLILPDKASAIMGVLLPMLYTHLSDILQKKEPWTAGETAFVTQFASYIDSQRRSAADLALADYQTWAREQHDEREAVINSLKNGDLNTTTQVYQIGIQSLEPPVPPSALLQEIGVGMTLNNGQLQAVTNYAYEVGQLSKNSTVLSTGEVGVKLEGVAAAIQLGSALAEGTGGATASFKLVKLAPDLETVFPHAIQIGEKAAKEARAALKEASDALKAAETAGDVAKAAKAAAEVAEAEKVVAGITKAMTFAEAIPVVGEVVAIVGDIIQIGIAANEYRQISDFNQAFQTAYSAAHTTTSVADLKAKMASADGQKELFTYLTAMMATGGSPPTTPKPTMTAAQVSQLSLSL